MTKMQKRKSGSKRASQASTPPSFPEVRNSVSTIPVYAWCLGLAAVTFAVYLPAIFHPFVNYDDYDYVAKNAHVQAGLSANTIAWAFTSTEAANWHPLTWLSHALDCEFYGLNPSGHHLTSVLLHVANVVLLFLILRRATNATWRSAMVAAVFGLHTLNVESVAWVAERKNVLSMFFFLLTLAAYGRYARRPSISRYLVVAITFALGLAAKPMLVTLPFVLLLLDYWPLQRVAGWTHPSPDFSAPQVSWPRLLIEKTPLLLLSVVSSAITMQAQSTYGTVRELAWTIRLGNALDSYAGYLLKLIWPVHLAVVYPHPLNRLMPAAVAASALLLIVITGIVWHERKRHPFAIVGWLWFLGTLIPVIGIVQVGDQAMADRYMYIPMIGMLVAFVWGANDLIDWISARSPSAERWRLAAGRIVPAAVLIVLAVLSVRQIGFWSSSFDLWSHTLDVTERNFVADDRMASLLLEQSQFSDANRYFEAAAQVATWDPISHLALGAAAQDRGDLQEAARDFVVATGAKSPNFLAYAYTNLAIIHWLLGDDAKARQEAQSAMADDPDAVRGMIRQQANMVQSNMVQANQAAPLYLRLGLLLQVAGQMQGARAAFEHALQLDPNFTPARQALQTQNLAR